MEFMTMSKTNAYQTLGYTDMPDIANQANTELGGTLNWVGMNAIELPVFIKTGEKKKIQTLANIQAYVNLIDPESKGIHMSRLYLALDQKLSMKTLTPNSLQKTLREFIHSHQSLSNQAWLELSFDFYEKRASLLSNNQGWKNYPAKIIASIRNGQQDIEMSLRVPYSSTCPCSAALARQLIQEGFQKQFQHQETINREEIHQWLGTTQGISATPHSQRSIAQIRVKLTDKTEDLPLSELINRVESALKTPVQAAVKREDEQEFARLNAQNLMFCEDAARRLKHTLSEDISIRDFWIRVNHLESLHAHDAVAIAIKGVQNGYSDHLYQ